MCIRQKRAERNVSVAPMDVVPAINAQINRKENQVKVFSLDFFF